MNVNRLLHELELKLFAFDRLRCGREWNYPQVVSPFARLFHVLSGEAVIHYAGRDWPLRPGRIVLAPPFTPVDYHCDTAFENYYAIFTCHTRTGLDFFTLGTFAGSLEADALTGPLFQRLLELNPGCGLHQVDPRRPNYNGAIWAADPEQRFPPENLLATDGILRLLLAPFVGTFRLHTGGSEAGGRFLPVLQYIVEHLHQPLTLIDLAAVARLQPTYFSDGGTLYTTSSFIGYNDFNADARPFLKQRDKGTNKDAAEAKIFQLATTQEQQFDLYRKVQGLRVRINVNNEDVCGTYKVLINNCGTWAVNMIQSQGIKVPEGVRKLNVYGAGIGGAQDYLPFTYMLTGGAATYGYGKLGIQATYSVGKSVAVATGQGASYIGNTTKDLAERSGGKIYVAPVMNENNRGGVLSAGIRWDF